MIAGLIRWSIANRFLVLVTTLLVAAWGTVSLPGSMATLLTCSATLSSISRTSGSVA